MKKLLLSLACAFVAMVGLNANAQNLYMMGSGDGLSWESFPGKVITPQSDGSYSVTINNLNAFKISTANAANWDAFNAGAIGYSGTFGDAVGTSAGQTVTIGSWGENQQMPWIGTYTITINSTRTSMTVKTTTPKPTEAPAVYVRGDMNGWGSPDTYKFTYNSASDSYSLDCSISKGLQFKIADANWGSINYGGPSNITATGQPITLTSNGNNMTMGEDFNGTIVFKISGSTATATFTQSGSGPSYPENMYIIGTVNGGGWNPTNGVVMTNDGEGKYSAENVTFTEQGGSTGFAITAALGTSDSDWAAVNALRFGPAITNTPVKFNEANEAAIGDLSWSINPGTYTLHFDYTERILTVEVVSATEPTIPETIYLKGDFNEWNGTAMTKQEEMSDNNEYVYTVTLESLSGDFKVCESQGAETWTGLNYGANGDANIFTSATTLEAWSGSDVNFNLPEEQTNVKVTFYYNTNKTQASYLQLEWDNVTIPEAFYFRSEANGWGTGTEMALQDEEANDKGEYVYQITGLSMNNPLSFKISEFADEWGENNFGCGANGIFDSATTLQAYKDGGNFVNKTNLEDITLTFYYNPTGDSWLQLEGSYPENMYIIGTEAGNVWNIVDPTTMVNEGDGFYTIENVVLMPADENEYAFFSFTTTKGENDDDWNAVNAKRYGPAENETLIEEGEEAEMERIANNSWKIAPAVYNIYVSLEDMIVEVEKVGDLEESFVLSGPIFVDNATTTMEMTLEDGVYTVTANVWPQNFNIKKMVNGIAATTYAAETDADAANQITRFGDFQGKANSTIDWILSGVVATPITGSELIFTFDPETMVLNISPVPAPVELTLTGVNYQEGTITDDHISILTAREYGIVVVEGLEEGNELYYKVTENESANGVKALAEDADGFTLMTDNQILLPLGEGTLDYYVVSNGVKSSTKTYTYAVEYDFATGIFDIDMDGEGAEYFTIQGVKVANPEKGGIYIKVVNGKATKVVR